MKTLVNDLATASRRLRAGDPYPPDRSELTAVADLLDRAGEALMPGKGDGFVFDVDGGNDEPKPLPIRPPGFVPCARCGHDRSTDPHVCYAQRAATTGG